MLRQIQRPNSKNSFFLLVTDDETFNEEALEEGIHFVEYKEDTKTGNYYTVRSYLSSVIYIKEKLVSENRNFLKIVIHDDTEIKEKYVSPKDLYNINSSKNDAYDWLLNNGLKVYGKKSILLEYLLLSEDYAEKKPATENTGWHYIEKTKSWEYVANGLSTTDETIYVGSAIAEFKCKGDKETQRDFFKLMFLQHPIVFGITAYLNAGFINFFVNEDNNQLMAVTGISTAGKSTAAKIGYSYWTNPQDFLSMNATQYGITHTLSSFNHNGIFFDETGEKTIDDRNISQFIYSLASGKERLRMKKFGSSFSTELPERSFYSLLICGEVSIINGLKVQEGISQRLCEIVLDDKIRIFDFPPEEDLNTRQAQVEDYNKIILSNYGHLAKETIENIKKDIPNIEKRYQFWLEAFRTKSQYKSSLANRKLKIMAYISTSAEYIANVVYHDEPDIIPAVLEEMQNAIQSALFNSVADLEDTKDKYKSALNNFEDLLAGFLIQKSHGSEILDYRIKPKEIWGEVDITPSFKKILIINDRLNEVALKLDLDSKLLLAYLKDKGFLELQDNKSTKVVKRDGQSKRYYCIKIPMSFFDSVETVEEITAIQEEIDTDNPWIPPPSN